MSQPQEPKREYENDVLHQRWLLAINYLRTESKCGFSNDQHVERVENTNDNFFLGKRPVVARKT